MRTETLIVGAGHAGLALSRHLTRLGSDHVLLERSRVGARWHEERWDSLALLSPNWLNRLPGQSAPSDPDGFTSSASFAASLETYAASFGAPVLEGVNVERVEPAAEGFRVCTSCGTWTADNVVVATGDCGVPLIPTVAAEAPADVQQLHVRDYRHPGLVKDGGVLVVGAGPSGQQVARELREAGREVVLAAGRHARAPRRYRGRDIWWWLDEIGVLDDTIEGVTDPETTRRAPSLSLSGARGGVDIDLGLLHDEGVEIAGRLVGFEGSRAVFAPDLCHNMRAAERAMSRMLETIDAYIAASGEEAPASVIAPVDLPGGPAYVDLRERGIATVLWATGYGRDYGWIDVPGALGPDGELLQRRGISPVPGLYTLGIRFQHWRSSHFIGGVGRDAEWLAEVIAARVCLAA